MKKLTFNQMQVLRGGKYSCISMVLGFAGALAASFAGPAGILLGAGMFVRGVTSAGDCEREGGLLNMFS